MKGMVLVVNAGSSSLKYEVLDPESGEVHASGLIERIGEPMSEARHDGPQGTHKQTVHLPNHDAAFELALEAFRVFGPDLDAEPLYAVGHRVVHGGDLFSQSTLIDERVIAAIKELTPLAPLHNPANLEGIELAMVRFPDIPQVAVFDTAFHQTLPPEAYTYALPLAWREDLKVRRYGFHGTSHQHVSRRAAVLLGRTPEEVNVITLHLGNGASACAVEAGRSIDTSMGMSPLEGLVMGTRSGDIDPSIPAHLHRAGIPVEEYDRAVTRDSGLKALVGSNDFREVLDQRAAGDANATLAFDLTAHRLRKYIGGYAATLGHVDALVFTAGIGEHAPALRAASVNGLEGFGVLLDEAANEAATSGEHLISTPESRVAVYVIPTNEELEIARQAALVVSGAI